MKRSVKEAVAAILEDKIVHWGALTGGCVGQVYQAQLADGRTFVVKVDEAKRPLLSREGYMLTYLRAHSRLPVPAVYHCDDNLLIMAYLPGNSHFGVEAQRHAAELLADLHGQTAPAFGLEKDTLIGGLHQPNEWRESWLTFFREQRLLYMAEQGVQMGHVSTTLYRRLVTFCAQLERWLLEPNRPSLIHGDVWTTNVLAQGERITGFIDPAIYYAHPEIELAFTTLFGTFGRPFFDRYHEIRPIAAGFFEERCDIYNLYPLLVHVCLFGSSYVTSVKQTLQRFGC